jgi:hypothetical protein
MSCASLEVDYENKQDDTVLAVFHKYLVCVFLFFIYFSVIPVVPRTNCLKFVDDTLIASDLKDSHRRHVCNS